MFLIEYKYYDDISNGWEMDAITFKKMNLLVGDSGAGKTKILNTIYNICFTTVVAGQISSTGHWIITFKISDSQDVFIWDIQTQNGQVLAETLKQNNKIIVARTLSEFKYNNTTLPQLDRTQSALKLLSNEKLIKSITTDFQQVIRRNFFDGELEAQSNMAIFEENTLAQDNNFQILNGLNNKNNTLPMVMRLYILSKEKIDEWNKIKEAFLGLFPNFTDMFFSVNPGSNNQKQIFVKEDGEEVILNELSSGVKKTLLIISDIITLKKGSIYLIDEIENSLGNNILNELIEFINEYLEDIQFIITSHHPYIINNIPYKNWKIIKRQGKKIIIKNGEDLSENFKLSKQDAYIKLQNM